MFNKCMLQNVLHNVYGKILGEWPKNNTYGMKLDGWPKNAIYGIKL